MKVILILVFTAVSAMAADLHYRIAAEIDPAAGMVNAKTRVRVRSVPSGNLKFYLNSNFRVANLSCRPRCTYSFQKEKAGEYRYASQAAPLILTFATLPSGVVVDMEYQGKLPPTNWGENLVQADWTELALYSAWFPLMPDTPLTYDLQISIDPKYGVSGAGKVHRPKPGSWRITKNEPTFDINLVAAEQLRTQTLSTAGAGVQVTSAGVKAEAVDAIAVKASEMLQQFSKWFGPPRSSGFNIVLNPRKRGGAYARPGFVSLPFGEKDTPEGIERWLAHEVAHLWWLGAPTLTWEDWLNEAFAEYSSLMFVRHQHGAKAVDAYIERSRKRAADAPPIWGLDRNSDSAHAALYSKGAMILWNLEQQIGQETFNKVLRTRVKRGVRTTSGFLRLLNELAGPEVASQVESRLRQ